MTVILAIKPILLEHEKGGVSKSPCPRAPRGAAKEQTLSIRCLYGLFYCGPASSAGTG